MFTNEQLIQLANSFTIDPLLGVTLERRSENTWTLINCGCCLDKETFEWEDEPSPSNRTEEYISSTRFDSIEDAIKCYIEWRKNNFFIFTAIKGHRRHNCFAVGKENEVRKIWNELDREKVHGLWIFVGSNFEILDQYKSLDEYSKDLEFVDIIAKVAS